MLSPKRLESKVDCPVTTAITRRSSSSSKWRGRSTAVRLRNRFDCLKRLMITAPNSTLGGNAQIPATFGKLPQSHRADLALACSSLLRKDSESRLPKGGIKNRGENRTASEKLSSDRIPGPPYPSVRPSRIKAASKSRQVMLGDHSRHPVKASHPMWPAVRSRTSAAVRKQHLSLSCRRGGRANRMRSG